MLDIGTRMKKYEEVYRHKLLPRSCVIVRCDGRAFHSWTKKAKAQKPFDPNMITAMIHSAKKVAEEMQGFKIAFVQSDEVSFLITDFDTLHTQGWFDYVQSKVVSISASCMTYWFNDFWNNYNKSMPPAFFDSRAFVIPKEDVTNYFLWRSLDWQRNSLQLFARAYFSHKELNGKNHVEIHEMLYRKGVNWAHLSNVEKNGTFLIQNGKEIDIRHNILPNYSSISFVVEELLEIKEK